MECIVVVIVLKGIEEHEIYIVFQSERQDILNLW